VAGLTDDLEAIEEAITAAETVDDTEKEQLLEKAWEDYELAYKGCQEIFADYVDLVRGVLARDAGLDADLCRIADELMRSWPLTGETWESLSIPSYTEGSAGSKAFLIRLGFPEWSIWSLPLIAREYGNIAVATHPSVRKRLPLAVDEGFGSADELRVWAAEVFATAAMGPAYPWASTLLRADPRSAVDRKRVAIMLETLSLLGAGDTRIVELSTAWRRATGESPDLDEQTARFVREIWGKTANVRFKGWEAADALTDDLLVELPVSKIATKLTGETLCNVLVAAWQARVSLVNRATLERRQGLSEDQRLARRSQLQQELVDLAKLVRETCMRVLNAGQPGTESKGRPSTPAMQPDTVESTAPQPLRKSF
jgi:hypothetical protein